MSNNSSTISTGMIYTILTSTIRGLDKTLEVTEERLDYPDFSQEINELQNSLQRLRSNTQATEQMKIELLQICSEVLVILEKITGDETAAPESNTSQFSSEREELVSTIGMVLKALERSQTELRSSEAHMRELSALQTATAALLKTIDLETLLGQILGRFCQSSG